MNERDVESALLTAAKWVAIPSILALSPCALFFSSPLIFYIGKTFIYLWVFGIAGLLLAPIAAAIAHRSYDVSYVAALLSGLSLGVNGTLGFFALGALV